MINYTVTVKIFMDSNEENPKSKIVRESYLVKAVSVTDAETKTVHWLAGLGSSFQVEDVRRSKIIDIIGFENEENVS